MMRTSSTLSGVTSSCTRSQLGLFYPKKGNADLGVDDVVKRLNEESENMLDRMFLLYLDGDEDPDDVWYHLLSMELDGES